MDSIQKIRVDNLRLFFATHPIPKEEKSLISQLLNGKASFGEKLARRLERDLGMITMSLDVSKDVATNDKALIIARHLSVLPEEKLDALAVILGIKLQ